MSNNGLYNKNRSPIILIADDSETFLMYVSVLLQRMGFDVVAAKDGEEALKFVNVVMPDIIILDIIMPVMDGVATLKKLKADNNISSIPVIMTSIDAREDVNSLCDDLGSAGFLKKPVKISDLNGLIAENMIFPRNKRRRHLRSAWNKKVELVHNGTIHQCYAVNLSEGGIYIRKRDPFSVGTEVMVSLPVNSHDPLTIGGIVIYQRGLYGDMMKIAPGMGIEFQDLSPDDSTMLRDYVTDLLTEDIIAEQEEEIITVEKPLN